MKPVSSGFRLGREELKKDRKNAARFGPCGLGTSAVYMGGMFLERHYYAPVNGIERIWKRVAMSRGGFTGKGAFGSVPYIVIRMKDGTEKASLFRSESAADEMLKVSSERFPAIPVVSRGAEARLEAKRRESDAKNKKALPEEAEKTVGELERLERFLSEQNAYSRELSDAAGHMRSFLLSKGACGWSALAVTVLGAAALVFGIIRLAEHGFRLTGDVQTGDYGIFLVLSGLAAIFLFAGYSVLPAAKNNRRTIEKRVRRAQENMQRYMRGFEGDAEALIPARYAHPVVARWMIREIREGNAVTAAEALEAVKERLKKLNSSVTVGKEEYDDVVRIKAMFLNAGYQ